MIACALSLAMAFAAAGAPSPSPMPWGEVRAAVGELICANVHSRPDGREAFSVVAGVREYCKLPPAGTPLQRAVDKACERAQRLIASIHPEGLSAAYEKGLSPDERTRRAREAYLASEDFLRAVVPRLSAAMTEEGLTCSGCPEFPPRPVRKATWSEFAPYLAAYVWPDPVRTPKDANGTSSGMPNYSFHVCGGLNGIGEMKDPDPLLVRAGFLVAFRNSEFLESAGTHFTETLNEPAFQKLDDDEARTRYLRNRMPSETVKDPTARVAACRALAEVSVDIGVEVPDCLEAKVPPVAVPEKR